ncbi:hypothetical protein ACI8AC_23790 [Geodermatophilus sp. SYSU D00758]
MTLEDTASRRQHRGLGGRRDAWALLRPLVRRLHSYAGVLSAPFLLVTASAARGATQGPG